MSKKATKKLAAKKKSSARDLVTKKAKVPKLKPGGSVEDIPGADAPGGNGKDADIVTAPSRFHQMLPVEITKSERRDFQGELAEAYKERREKGEQWKFSIAGLKTRCSDLEEEIDRTVDENGSAAGEKLAGLTDRLRSAEAALGEATTRKKAEITEIESRIDRLAMVVNSGVEFREVECRLDRDHKTKSVRTVRIDTDAVISERAMYDAEMQATLPLEE